MIRSLEHSLIWKESETKKQFVCLIELQSSICVRNQYSLYLVTFTHFVEKEVKLEWIWEALIDVPGKILTICSKWEAELIAEIIPLQEQVVQTLQDIFWLHLLYFSVVVSISTLFYVFISIYYFLLCKCEILFIYKWIMFIYFILYYIILYFSIILLLDMKV